LFAQKEIGLFEKPFRAYDCQKGGRLGPIQAEGDGLWVMVMKTKSEKKSFCSFSLLGWE
jgi:hypothetical protein